MSGRSGAYYDAVSLRDQRTGYVSIVAMAAALAVSVTIVRAGTWDKKTTVRFSQPVEVPGQVLPPGIYVIKLADFDSDRHWVEFMNTRENHIYATAATIPVLRVEPTERTEIVFYEARAGHPEP